MTADRQARFRTLWENEPLIAAYALRRARSVEDAADVVADTFAIAWQRLDDIPAGREALLWLYVTARNVLANDYRRGQRRSALVERLGNELSRVVNAQEAPDEDGLSARRLLALLPDADREILMLAGWEGLDSSELGRVLNCSSVAARIRLHRARARMSRLSLDTEVMPEQGPPVEHVPQVGATE